MKAIFDLDIMLIQEGIPHVLQSMGSPMEPDFGWQIVYPDNENRKADVVCNRGSYGHENDLLEAYGFDEIQKNDVQGYLTAEEALGYFVRQWKKDNGDDTTLY